jgi:FkbM family methyltransferase
VSLRSQIRRYLLSYPEWNFRLPRVEWKTALRTVGNEYGGYLVDESSLRPDSVVYSLGVGKDISFDLAMIEAFGVAIDAFDPTPEVKAWLATQTLPSQFRFHDVGIADTDGNIAFYLPPRSDYISHSIVHARQYSSDSIQVPIARLSTVMRQLGHLRIDVLKMDIEGAEYAVIEDIVRSNIHVGQILVEFHHRLSGVGTSRTRRALELLEARGMKVAHVCPRLEVFTLIRAA